VVGGACKQEHRRVGLEEDLRRDRGGGNSEENRREKGSLPGRAGGRESCTGGEGRKKRSVATETLR